MTREEKDALAHIVMDPDAWMAHVVATFGQAKADEFLRQKVARWRPIYEAAKAAEGVNYRTRAQREG